MKVMHWVVTVVVVAMSTIGVYVTGTHIRFWWWMRQQRKRGDRW